MLVVCAALYFQLGKAFEAACIQAFLGKATAQSKGITSRATGSQLESLSNRFPFKAEVEPLKTAATAYFLALRGIELPKNLARMDSVYQRYHNQVEGRAKLVQIVECLPSAYYDIVAAQETPKPIFYLWKMELDGGPSELQYDFLGRCLRNNPNAFLNAVRLKDDAKLRMLVEELHSLEELHIGQYTTLVSKLRHIAKTRGEVSRRARLLLRHLGTDKMGAMVAGSAMAWR